ncbi:glucan biosynthesis protein [Breoghania sp.]|uniref:glucan biosynthesis protein n=1 Tax=Breoghania sp. TaxID=2065378 RepID=UPI0026136929|nr:glucan biosynthesis protein [Breoghania sp.]MDJ0931441.1 glucan biosynthesis protein [Breoghania sp.]
MLRILSGLAFFIAAAAAPVAYAQTSEPAPKLGTLQPFDFNTVIERARALAAQPYMAEPVRTADTLEKIDYDAHWKIKFGPSETITIGKDAPIQFFHMGRYFKDPVRMYSVKDGKAREILYSPDAFEMPDDSPAKTLPHDIGFAGLRVMRADLKTDWISYLGASYFRTDGQSRQYGLSARGLEIDTGLSTPEEFPRFSDFWLAPPEHEGQTLIIYALMRSPSVTGAYKMALTNKDGKGQIIDVDSRLFFRKAVERLGVGPLTSMYWYLETNRSTALDWRPEVHDTDSLAILSGTGEHIWHPLNNPDTVRTSTFAAPDVKGFGLAQRDHKFEDYQDDGIFYNKCPSVWIEPRKPFGPGSVQLVEIPTDDEIFDNIVAYWTPKVQPKAGDERNFSYRMTWADHHPIPDTNSQVVATRVGQGGVPSQPRPKDQIKVVIDFEGPALKGLTQQSGVKPVVKLSKDKATNPYALPVVGTDRWRLIFDAKTSSDGPVEARVYLKRGYYVLSETWLGQLYA